MRACVEGRGRRGGDKDERLEGIGGEGLEAGTDKGGFTTKNWLSFASPTPVSLNLSAEQRS